MNANKFIAGLGKEHFIHPDHISEKGGAEKYLPQIERQVNIKMEHISTKGGAERHMPHLGKDWFIHPEHIEGGVVVFKADKPGATVTIGASVSTAIGKNITVKDLPIGASEYTVSLADHTSVTGTITMPEDANKEIAVTLVSI